MTTIADISRVCHEANRAWCLVNGDDSQTPWITAPDWHRDSVINGVKFAIMNSDAPASAQHDAWMAEKIADGWVYGETKDANTKTHPCLVPFDQLPKYQQQKDRLFRAIVKALTE